MTGNETPDATWKAEQPATITHIVVPLPNSEPLVIHYGSWHTRPFGSPWRLRDRLAHLIGWHCWDCWRLYANASDEPSGGGSS